MKPLKWIFIQSKERSISQGIFIVRSYFFSKMSLGKPIVFQNISFILLYIKSIARQTPFFLFLKLEKKGKRKKRKRPRKKRKKEREGKGRKKEEKKREKKEEKEGNLRKSEIIKCAQL